MSLNESAKLEYQITLFVQNGFTQHHPEIADIYKCVEAPKHRGTRLARITLEQTWLANKSRKFDLMHHGGGTMPRIGVRKTVLTMHDVQYLSFPENFSRARHNSSLQVSANQNLPSTRDNKMHLRLRITHRVHLAQRSQRI